MKNKLPTDARKLGLITRLHHGEWRVTEKLLVSKKDAQANRRIVQIWYDGKCLFENHGVIALGNAIEAVERWVKTGYVPKPARKRCLGDHGNAVARGKRAVKWASGVIPKEDA